ncbi:MAG: 50S ribosomal protein L15 [Bacteroidota bacterium]|jgi:large subunit ribosomal protein L15|nr:50S ribosomal protein L15 [Bacteroidota bacterium]
MANHLGNLQYAEGSRKKKKRLGRGQGSGRGGTSTRGHKGAQSRSGAKRKPGFEGGQMPLQRRLPKFGFTNINRKEYLGINVARLEELVSKGVITDGVINPDVLYSIGVVAKRRALVKILGNGDLTSKLTITAHAFSATAKEKIEAAGGTATTVTA